MSSYTNLNKLIQDSDEPMTIMQRVVNESLKLISGADGAVVELLDPDGVTLTYVCCTGSLWSSLGLRLNSETSLSGLALRSNSTLICADSETDSRVDREACRKVGTISMICVPLVKGSTPLGVLKVSSMVANSFTDSDVIVLSGLAEFISTAIRSANEMKRVTSNLFADSKRGGLQNQRSQGQISDFISNVINPTLNENLEKRKRIENVLSSDAISFAFQPIIDLDSQTVASVEALARFVTSPHQTPDLWFSDAHKIGLGIALELAAAEKALQNISGLPAGTAMAINIGPEAILSQEMMNLLSAVDPTRVVIELTEHLEVEDYGSLVDRFAQIRGLGVRLAIDDTGSGFSSFSHIIKLSPDIMKLDRELIQDIDKDPVRMSLTAAVITFAGETSTEVIAEGIETSDELNTLRNLGVRYGQGYLLGKPAPLSNLFSTSH